MNEKIPLVVANFKANQKWSDLSSWIEKVSPQLKAFPGTVIICPSPPFIAAASLELQELKSPLNLGNQDLSRFQGGAYTGETSAIQIDDLVKYAIIGHSERRRNFGEDDEILKTKVENAQKAKVSPIFCIENSQTPIPQDVSIVAYEPTFAIGTGTPETPQNAKGIAREIKGKGDYLVLYGGSVTVANCRDYIEKDVIDGLLIGASSLDPDNFLAILNSLSS